MIELRDIEDARRRIADMVRITPMMPATQMRRPIAAGSALWLKLENLQVSGSFKARGAANKLAQLAPDELAKGLVTASGGNHGLGVAYAAWRKSVPARVYLPANSPEAKAQALRAWGADVRREGTVWDDANRTALEAARGEGMTYVHPFADPAVIAGQGTLGLEIADQLPSVGMVLVAIGGGGLIAGVASAIKARNPQCQVIGVEPTGAPTLFESVKADRLVELERIATAAGSLAPRRSAAINLAIVKAKVDRIVLVSDAEMRAAARWLWQEFGIGAELSAAAAVAALLAGRISPPERTTLCALICGAGHDGQQD